MKKLLIIPDRENMHQCMELAEKYNMGFEYNDFYWPDILDDDDKLNEIISDYKQWELPQYTTMHGAFFDVIPFSMDGRIREISQLRIEQSIEAARRIGVKAIVFHTNYNPFLNSESYFNSWIEINIKYWSGVLEKYPDINIYLENMFDTSPDIMVRLSESLCKYHNYGMCFDYAHASLSKVEPEVWARKLSKYIKHVHINDNDGVSDLHQAWGDGCINREVFYDCCSKYFNDATVLIEISKMEDKIKTLEILEKEGFLRGFYK